MNIKGHGVAVNHFFFQLPHTLIYFLTKTTNKKYFTFEFSAEMFVSQGEIKRKTDFVSCEISSDKSTKQYSTAVPLRGIIYELKRHIFPSGVGGDQK